MTDEHTPLVDRKPAIQVMVHAVHDADVQPILWGIEEEQIPATVHVMDHGGAAALAEQAAHASALNVGIAVDGVSGQVALHHRDLAGRPPLFVLSAQQASPDDLMNLGKNAARLVKGNPLVLADAALVDRLAALILDTLMQR